MKEDLKICPFCGNQPTLKINDCDCNAYNCIIECEPCGATITRYSPDKENAIVRAKFGWNSRYNS